MMRTRPSHAFFEKGGEGEWGEGGKGGERGEKGGKWVPYIVDNSCKVVTGKGARPNTNGASVTKRLSGT